MEFTLQAFTNRLRELMYTRFPYEPDAIKQKKHKKTPLHIVDVAFWKNPVITIDEFTIKRASGITTQPNTKRISFTS